MAHILLVYATTDGHTGKVAEFVADTFRKTGHIATLADAAAMMTGVDVASFDACILLGSVHQGHHQKSLVHFVQRHLASIDARPNAFLSVSLSAAAADEESRADTKAAVDSFVTETGWLPMVVQPVAGALLYTHYDWFKRVVMRVIAKSHGGDTDTHRDHVYTDWSRLRQFVVDFERAHLPAMAHV
ncbi:MAG: protoporphyrinogen oxidase [Armatimonadetes bacterium]|nr:protoporphyrinogen oxidase [Armatimonadota bacterium]